MSRRRFFTSLVMCLLVLTTRASELDSAYVERFALWHALYDDAMCNPALMLQAYDNSYTELSVSADYKKQNDAFRLELGTGYLQPEASATSFIRLSDYTVVWGKASYMNGKKFAVTWNSIADYDLLYPDIMADSVGGDTHRERYLFMGGYNTQLNRWQIGGELLFRAEQEYRTYDPRMRSVVSDLNLKVGIAYTLSDYRLAGALSGNIYRQTADVDFYADDTQTTEFQMTGLGASYVRFSSSNRDIFFEGLGGCLRLDFQPLEKSGWFGSLQTAGRHYDRISDEYNSMPLTTLYLQQSGILAGWKKKSSFSYAFWTQVLHDMRLSDEHVAGSAAHQDYPILVDLTMYKQYGWDACIAAQCGKELLSSNWQLRAKTGLKSHRESYVYPERKVEYTRFYGSLSAQWLKSYGRRFILNTQFDADYVGCANSKIQMPYANMTTGQVNYVNHNFEYQKASFTHLGAIVRGDYTLAGSPVSLFGRLGAGVVLASASGNEFCMNISMGITF